MAENEYIEREALRRNLNEDIEACGEEDSVCRPIAYGSILGLKMAMAYANTLPSADVVEVVRCENCQHSDLINCERWCTFHDVRMDDNDFCSYGEKMDGKGEGE